MIQFLIQFHTIYYPKKRYCVLVDIVIENNALDTFNKTLRKVLTKSNLEHLKNEEIVIEVFTKLN